MNKKVNISAIKSKMHFIYKDEREKNIAAIVIYNKDGKFFFDPEYKNVMTNLEVEALLLRGALVDREGKYYRPSSFNDNNVSFSEYIKHPIILDLLDKRKIMAHQNLPNEYPGNTITGILECIRAGIKYFELDFRESADGELFMIHDATTGRTSSTNITIATSTSEEIKSIIQDKLVNPKKYKNLGINTLDEVIEVIKSHNCYFNINFDYGPSASKKEEIISKIINAGILNKVILSASKFEDYAHLGVCLTKQIPLTDEAFIQAAKQGNIIAGYDYGYGKTGTYISDINNAMRLGAKYRVPILIWNTETYTIFKDINRFTYVNLMMVDRLWKRRDD